MKTQNNGFLKKLFSGASIKELAPGIIFSLALTVLAFYADKFFEIIFNRKVSLFSPILLALIIGLFVRNVLFVPKRLNNGIQFGIKKLLRFGIMIMGIRLSILSVFRIGIIATVMVSLCITAVIIVTILLAKKIKISKKMGLLIAAGTSICGVSAIVATAPAVEANEEETAYAIGVITILGLLSTIIYPYITELFMGLDVVQAGFFIGTSVNDTSQVASTALIYDQLWLHRSVGGLTGSDIAITTKLIRNTFMIVVIPIISFFYRKEKANSDFSSEKNFLKYIPLFVLGYLGFAIIRSSGDYFFGSTNEVWTGICVHLADLATFIIAVSISCIGLSIDIKRLIKLGVKPFVTGVFATLSVAGISCILVTIFSIYLNI